MSFGSKVEVLRGGYKLLQCKVPPLPFHARLICSESIVYDNRGIRSCSRHRTHVGKYCRWGAIWCQSNKVYIPFPPPLPPARRSPTYIKPNHNNIPSFKYSLFKKKNIMTNFFLLFQANKKKKKKIKHNNIEREFYIYTICTIIIIIIIIIIIVMPSNPRFELGTIQTK